MLNIDFAVVGDESDSPSIENFDVHDFDLMKCVTPILDIPNAPF